MIKTANKRRLQHTPNSHLFICYFILIFSLKSVPTPVVPVRTRESVALSRRNTTEIPMLKEVIGFHLSKV